MALSQAATRGWYLVHKWTSLVCTLFLLMFCLTGLPLIFAHEIDEATRAPVLAAPPAGARLDLDKVATAAVAELPGWKMLYLTWDEDKPLLYVTVGPTYDASPAQMKYQLFDARSGTRIETPPLDEGVMAFILDLHANLLLGLPGQLFLGLTGVVFLVAVVSGVVVYAPFMRKLRFGTVRKDRSRRLKWLDTHNMVGIVTLGWVAVVGLTGFIITMTVPITMIWQADQLGEMSAPYAHARPPERLASIDKAVATVRAAAPNARVSFVAWPGTTYSTKHHYMVALAGNTPLTARLINPAMVDAETGRLTDLRQMPLYMKALFLSAPLHFGDYGGLPLKIIWALLDIAAIVVLVSGLYLWLGKRRTPLNRRVAELRTGGALEPAE
ncbi:PepSY-associated TM helix domain-containing protein [Sphingomonas sp. BIUV-7]|uniref:PepSY-associated TM helix domain-containing protein n=1 Tax=Sphingomonas natans TaxID=3063330 RepID=A0ABT8YAX8_9SPHN|nr:PepSY-associated TM helix domain-containing protein [Sphingomonas sp. BIUV-7]MDO6415488.1 PepSY-associated TM helix domain-containing protein [Sphingomonas sp. BIUV-7]